MSEKASGLRQPSKIGRPCCAQTPKPALPPSPPRSSSMNSMEPIYENPIRKTSVASLRRESDTSVVLTEDTDSFIIGDRIWVGGTKSGSIAFIGETKFAPGEWAGVVLDDPIGKNDGSVAGTRYFQCAPKHGIFSRLTRLTRYPLSDASLLSPSGMKSPMSPESRLNKSISPSLNTSTTSLSSMVSSRDLKLGDRVIVSSGQGSKTGVLRYIGETEFAAGEWCGVELDDAIGKNDGSVADKRYFECRPKHGLFAPAHKVTRSPSSKRSSMCVVHKPSGAGLNSSMRRMSSRESLASVSSMASTTTSTATRGATSTTRRTGLRTSQPVRSTLQETLKEKQQEIEMLKKERDLERERITKAANQADFAEQTKAILKKEYDKYREDMEKKVIEIQNTLAILIEEKSQLNGLLEEEKQKCEDLLFRFEEESVNKEDIQVKNILNENKIKELESQLSEERERVIQLERENTKLFEVEEELAKIRSEKTDFQELQNRNLCLEEAKITLEKEVLERNDSIDRYTNEIKHLEGQLNSRDQEHVAAKDQEISLQKSYDDIKTSLEDKSVLMENMKKEYATISESMMQEIGGLKDMIDKITKQSNSEKESIVADYQKIIAEKDHIIQLKHKEIEEESVRQKDAQNVALERLTIENSSQISELSTKLSEQLAEKDRQIESLTRELEENSLKLEKVLNDFTNHKSLALKKEEELETAHEQLRELNAKLKLAEITENELKKEIDTLKSQNVDDINLMNEEKRKLEESLTSLLTSTSTYSTQLENINSDLESKKIELVQLQKSKATEIEELTRNFESQLEEKAKCLTEIGGDMTQKSMRLNNLEQEVADLKLQLTAKDEEIKPLLEKTSELKDAITLSEQTKTNLESELRMYEVSMAESNQKMSHAEEKIAQLTEQKNKLEADIANAISTSADSSDQLMKYNEELRSKEKELDEFRERTFHLEKLMTSSEAKMHRAEEELKVSNQTLDQYKSESGELKEQLDAHERHKEELIHELNSLKAEVREMVEVVKSKDMLKAELNSKNRMIQDLTEKLKLVEENASTLNEKCSLLSSSSEEQAKALHDHNKELEHELEASREQINTLQENERILLTEKTEKENSIEVLNDKLKSVIESNAKLEKMSIEKEDEIKNLNVKMVELEKEKAAVLETTCNEKQQTEAEMLMVSNCVTELKVQSKEAEAKFERDLGELKALIDERNAACSKLEQEATEIKQNNSKLQEEKAEHLTIIENTNKEKMLLETKLKSMESELNAVQNEIESKIKMIDELGNVVETLSSAEQQSLKESEHAFDIKINELKSALDNSTKELDAIKLEKLKQHEMLEVFKADANKRESEIAHLQQEIATMKTEKEALTKTQEERNQAFQAKEIEIKTLLEQNKNYESVKQTLEKNFSEAEEKLKLLSCSKKNNEEESLKRIRDLTEELNTLKISSAMSRNEEDRLDKENKQLLVMLNKTQEELKTLTENKKNVTETNSRAEIIITAAENSEQAPSNNIEFQKMIEDNEMYRGQIDFLNSVIVDMQKKNEKLLCKIEVLEMGMPANEADDYNRVTLDNKGAAPRMFCDICDQFDLHETEDCPKQSQDFEADKPQPKSGKKPAAERPYCETCEMFGHDTADCDDAETF